MILLKIAIKELIARLLQFNQIKINVLATVY